MPRAKRRNGEAAPRPHSTAPRASDCGPPCSLAHQPCIYRESFDNSFDLLCLLDGRGQVLQANRTALNQRNLKASQVQDLPIWLTPWWDISLDAQTRLKAAVREAAKGRLVRYEVDLLGRDGGTCTYDVAIKLLAGKSSDGKHLLCAARDISERKRIERALVKAREDSEIRGQSRTADLSAANEQLKQEISHRHQTEQALRDSEAQIQAMLHTAADAILTISERGIVTSFNPAAENMFGYRAEEVIGRNVKMLMPEPYFSEHDRYLQSYLRSGKAKIIGIGREVLGRRKDGYTFPLDLAVSEVRANSEPRAAEQRTFTGIARDITERKRLEREILEISDQEQLRIGQDLHDGLGQQLTGVAFMVKVLAEDLAAENSSLAESAKKIARLVQDAIARTRDLAHGLSPVGLETRELAPALSELARSTHEIVGVPCAFICNRPVAPDETAANVHLYRIAQESVNNAIKHGKAKNISIQLSIADGKGLLVIADDGIGLRRRTRARHGMGMRIMAYRATMIGASLMIQPGPASSGTIVTCTFALISRGKRDRSNGNQKAPSTSPRATQSKGPAGRRPSDRSSGRGSAHQS